MNMTTKTANSSEDSTTTRPNFPALFLIFVLPIISGVVAWHYGLRLSAVAVPVFAGLLIGLYLGAVIEYRDTLAPKMAKFPIAVAIHLYASIFFYVTLAIPFATSYSPSLRWYSIFAAFIINAVLVPVHLKIKIAHDAKQASAHKS